MKKNKIPQIGDYEFTDLPMEYFCGAPRLEIIGNECLVDGLEGIVEYTPDKIKIAVGRQTITFVGSKLHINSFSHKGALIEGCIMTMEFSD